MRRNEKIWGKGLRKQERKRKKIKARHRKKKYRKLGRGRCRMSRQKTRKRIESKKIRRWMQNCGEARKECWEFLCRFINVYWRIETSARGLL